MASQLTNENWYSWCTPSALNVALFASVWCISWCLGITAAPVSTSRGWDGAAGAPLADVAVFHQRVKLGRAQLVLVLIVAFVKLILALISVCINEQSELSYLEGRR